MQTKLSEVQTESVDLEIIQLLKKGVIQPCQHEAGEFISPIFTRPKKGWLLSNDFEPKIF